MEIVTWYSSTAVTLEAVIDIFSLECQLDTGVASDPVVAACRWITEQGERPRPCDPHALARKPKLGRLLLYAISTPMRPLYPCSNGSLNHLNQHSRCLGALPLVACINITGTYQRRDHHMANHHR